MVESLWRFTNQLAKRLETELSGCDQLVNLPRKPKSDITIEMDKSGKSEIQSHLQICLWTPELSLGPTCPKNANSHDFPTSGIFTIIAILRTAMFRLIGRIADCSWYLPVMV